MKVIRKSSFIFGLIYLLYSCEFQQERKIKTEGEGPVIKSGKLEEKGTMQFAASPRLIASAFTPGFLKSDTDTSLLSQYIRCIFQDKEGKLWFGTVGEGVVCYDGLTLRYFRPKEGFAGVSVQEIVQDKGGTLWFATDAGITAYDGKIFTNYTTQDGLSDQLVFALLIDHRGVLWAGTDKGFCRFEKEDDKKGLFTTVSIPGHLEGVQVRDLLEDRIHNIWLATINTGAFCYNGSSFKQITKEDGLAGNNLLSLCQDKKGKLWFSCKGEGLTCYDVSAAFEPGGQIFRSFVDEKGSNDFGYIYEDRSGSLWVAVRGAVRRYDGTSFSVISAADGLNNCCVQSIFEDRAGNLWFGSGNGLFLLDKNRLEQGCRKGACAHHLKIEKGMQEHQNELRKTVFPVFKKGPWPAQFR